MIRARLALNTFALGSVRARLSRRCAILPFCLAADDGGSLFYKQRCLPGSSRLFIAPVHLPHWFAAGLGAVFERIFQF